MPTRQSAPPSDKHAGKEDSHQSQDERCCGLGGRARGAALHALHAKVFGGGAPHHASCRTCRPAPRLRPLQLTAIRFTAIRFYKRHQLGRRRSSEYAAAKEAFDELAARQAAVLEKVRPAALAAALARRADEVDAESDALCAASLWGPLVAGKSAWKLGRAESAWDPDGPLS